MAKESHSIGYALEPKKQKTFLKQSLTNLAISRSLNLIKIEPEKPLTQQGPFDIIIHKLYDPNWKHQLTNYKHEHPNTIIIDQPDSIELLHNRISMIQLISDLKIIHPPKQTIVHNPTCFPRDGDFNFPLIAKPLVSDGSTSSHDMSLVYNRNGFSQLKPPVVLQEFVNHGGVVFKVYVVGEYVECVVRKSLPDVSNDLLLDESETGFSSFSNVSNSCVVEGFEMLSREFVVEVARGLRERTGLNLFNFDVIRDSKEGDRCFVIDVNYFPGFEKIDGYENVFTDFLLGLLDGKRGDDLMK